MKALEDRIAKAKAGLDQPRTTQDHHTVAQVAWRMVTELVAGIGIGVGVGYGLDYLLGTSPFLLMLFTLLGFAAGVLTLLRTARELQNTTGDNAAPSKTDAEKGD